MDTLIIILILQMRKLKLRMVSLLELPDWCVGKQSFEAESL